MGTSRGHTSAVKGPIRRTWWFAVPAAVLVFLTVQLSGPTPVGRWADAEGTIVSCSQMTTRCEVGFTTESGRHRTSQFKQSKSMLIRTGDQVELRYQPDDPAVAPRVSEGSGSGVKLWQPGLIGVGGLLVALLIVPLVLPTGARVREPGDAAAGTSGAAPSTEFAGPSSVRRD